MSDDTMQNAWEDEPTAKDEYSGRSEYPPVPEKLEMDLVGQAIDKGLTIETIRALIEMKVAEEERQAALLYAQRFAEMQAEFTSAERTKEGYGYKYAPLEVLQKSYGPVIAKHGFSYRWREEALEVGKRVIMTIAGHGHSEETTFDIPPLDGTERMNAIQVMGAMSTYGRRYTFIAGFGVIIEDEDPDGRVSEMEKKQPGEVEGERLYTELKSLIGDKKMDGTLDEKQYVAAVAWLDGHLKTIPGMTAAKKALVKRFAPPEDPGLDEAFDKPEEPA